MVIAISHTTAAEHKHQHLNVCARMLIHSLLMNSLQERDSVLRMPCDSNPLPTAILNKAV